MSCGLEGDSSGAGTGTGTVLGRFLCWILVFVILTFFKEGIGNNLTMPSGSWVWVLNLGSWKWDLGQGLLVLAESL
jgi:hypothetical protein